MLVVDDNETNRIILNEQLSAWKLDVSHCADGPSALAVLREAANTGKAFDLAVLDMQMPGMDGIELAEAIKSDSEINAVKLMLLTSAALDIDAESLATVGIQQFTTKPARQSQLFNCLMSLVGDPAPAPGPEQAPDGEAQDVTGTLRGRILLVEDNAVNQEVARNMLEDIGCEVSVVENGQLALSKCETESFDAILMDCQMPVMDGFEATVALREGSNAKSLKFETPIIALTANALAGDRERCLAAGMDDYISKPFKQSELHDVLGRWLEGGHDVRMPRPLADEVDLEPETGVAINEAALDNLRALQRPGRPDVLAKVVRLYFERSPAIIEEIVAAGTAHDYPALQTAAHGLKSSSANLGANDMMALCRELEERARNCTPEGVAERIASLDKVFSRTVRQLERICPTIGADAVIVDEDEARRKSA